MVLVSGLVRGKPRLASFSLSNQTAHFVDLSYVIGLVSISVLRL